MSSAFCQVSKYACTPILESQGPTLFGKYQGRYSGFRDLCKTLPFVQLLRQESQQATECFLFVHNVHQRGSVMLNTVSTAEARKKLSEIINKVAYGKEPVVFTRRGKEIAALISMEELELLQLVEDHIDIEDARKALEEPGKNISAEKLWKELGL